MSELRPTSVSGAPPRTATRREGEVTSIDAFARVMRAQIETERNEESLPDVALQPLTTSPQPRVVRGDAQGWVESVAGSESSAEEAPQTIWSAPSPSARPAEEWLDAVVDRRVPLAPFVTRATVVAETVAAPVGHGREDPASRAGNSRLDSKDRSAVEVAPTRQGSTPRSAAAIPSPNETVRGSTEASWGQPRSRVGFVLPEATLATSARQGVKRGSESRRRSVRKDMFFDPPPRSQHAPHRPLRDEVVASTSRERAPELTEALLTPASLRQRSRNALTSAPLGSPLESAHKHPLSERAPGARERQSGVVARDAGAETGKEATDPRSRPRGAVRRTAAGALPRGVVAESPNAESASHLPNVPAPPVPQSVSTVGASGAGAPPAPVPIHSVELPVRVESVPERIRSAFERGTRELRLRLDPPELGGVDIKLSVDGREVKVAMRVEHQDAATLLQSALYELRAQLAQSGLTLADVEVSSDSRGDSDASPREERRAHEEEDSSERVTEEKQKASRKDVRAIA